MTLDNFDSVRSVSLLGAGHCGCAFAADLASRGKDVMLYGTPEHSGAIPMIEENDNHLKAWGNVNGRFKIHTTTDMGVALRHSQFLIITVPSFAQNDILRVLRPFDLRNHVLIVNVGNFFFLSASQNTNAKVVLETDISPYATRLEGDTILVKGTKKRLAIWAAPTPSQFDSPNYFAETALKRQVETIFPQHLDWCQSLLQVGLNNINPVVHAPAILMNTGWIEATRGDFYFYGQGMSPSVSRVSERIDEERLAIARAYGFELVGITDYMNQNYQFPKKFQNYHEFASGSAIHNKTKGAPTNMKHRYLVEDIGHCMVRWYELGLKCGLDLPAMRTLIDLASIVSGFDYLKKNTAGLGEATKEQISLALGGSLGDTPKVLTPLEDAHVKANSLGAHIPLGGLASGLAS